MFARIMCRIFIRNSLNLKIEDLIYAYVSIYDHMDYRVQELIRSIVIWTAKFKVKFQQIFLTIQYFINRRAAV